MKLFSILLVTVSLFAVSCERHEFEGPQGTKQLNEEHHKAGATHEEHAEHEAPAHHEEHAEKPAAH